MELAENRGSWYVCDVHSLLVAKFFPLGNSLLTRFTKAVQMRARHTALHAEYTAEFRSDDITAWKAMITAWERDRTNPNPFEDTVRATSRWPTAQA